MHQLHSPCIIPNVADSKGQVHGQSITNRKKWDGVGMVAPGRLGDTVSTWPLLSIFSNSGTDSSSFLGSVTAVAV